MGKKLTPHMKNRSLIPPFISMDIKIEDVSSTRKTAHVTVPADKISEIQKKVVSQYASQARIPGFRPGKAPANVILSRYGKGIEKEVMQGVIREAYASVREEKSLDIYALVDVGEPVIEAGKDTKVRLEIDVVPSFKLPEYKGLEVPVQDTSVSDADINSTIENIRRQRAEFKKIDDVASAGDYVKLSYEGKINGEAFPEQVAVYGKQTGTWEEAGAEDPLGASVKEIANALIGMQAGDKKELTVTFADDFAKEELRGKTANYTLDVAEVRQRVLPEMNEEFFKALQVADEAELKKQVREGLETNKKNAARSKTREAVIAKLNELVDFDLPQSALDRESHNIFLEYANTQLRQGVKVEEIQAKRDELMEDTKEAAKTRVKTQLILNAIAKAEGIKVEESDLNARIRQEDMMSGMAPEKFAKELSKNREHVIEMQANILHNKALDIVVDAAKETDTATTEVADKKEKPKKAPAKGTKKSATKKEASD